MTFDAWLDHFRANPARQRAIEAQVDWDVPCALDERSRRAFVRSFQRFALGEDGDGRRLLAEAERAGDLVYLAALRLLVAEEQRHAALFRRGLAHLGGEPLTAHWSDGAFTALRRALGLRTEIALFLVAEVVAMRYFVALERSAPDPVLRGIGRRIATDERNHLRFQIDRLREGFARTPGPVRACVGAAWVAVAAGATVVVVIDHRAALRACGLRPAAYARTALWDARAAVRSVLGSRRHERLGPATVR
ncbi:ferritin-like domain-containing protein [Cellulomonas pakistanensis]|uniref:Ferritin-like domain-containing protein n=1 Tax=Cellulomonas pakistanensis TaxID=992287 RepID=A0A919PAP8_9CELL|nr:ferritin-like domain-containing protein [Cellulomonas pakistanensis]GIG37530.1 hypothetical protein Cpa01nite_29110 [Cellulomonas pakistanensis]